MMKIKMILPALTEAKSPYWRPIKYSLFPPLGLASLAAYTEEEVEIVDEHVEEVKLDDEPDLVVIQVYITSARRSYEIADSYRSRGIYVVMGGLHITSLPMEGLQHADTIVIGPAEHSWPEFLTDWQQGHPKRIYFSSKRSLSGEPLPRRELIKRELYLVPNSIIISRGCPHHCSFCYKESFFKGGRSFFTRKVDEVLYEINSLPGRHLYFLDDHLFADRRLAAEVFEGMKDMGRLFQGAATVDSILRGDLIEKAAKAGLRSLFIGFETLNKNNLRASRKMHNLGRDYDTAIKRLKDLGIMINGSFVYGFDDDGPDVFKQTVDWAIERAITTATFHILTPYPGSALFDELDKKGRIIDRDWAHYDTRRVVFRTRNVSAEALKQGYDESYRMFYRYSAIARAAFNNADLKNMARHLAYTLAWKKFEPLWNFVIKNKWLRKMRPFLEMILNSKNKQNNRPRGSDLPAMEENYDLQI